MTFVSSETSITWCRWTITQGILTSHIPAQLDISNGDREIKELFLPSWHSRDGCFRNGTQFSSAEFRTFADRWNFSHVTGSPHYPQSNGAAERAVKTVKEILRQDIFLALLSYRSTPIPDLGASPAELAVGRKLRTTMPSLPSTLQPRVISHKEVPASRRQKEDYDRRHGVQPLPELSPGVPVLIKTDGEKGWKLPGEAVRKCVTRSQEQSSLQTTR